jgi:molybdopterin molybdotransferase
MPAPPPFARFVAIVWSGARHAAAQRRAIVRCVIERRRGGSQVTGLQGGHDRRETVAWLAERAEDGVRTLVGLDFPFAYAVPFLDHLDAPDFSALLARMAPLEEASAAPDRVDAFIAECGQWWADWGHEDHRTRRHVERVPETRGAESPLRALPHGRGYRFVGPRQVGKAAITGIAAIAALKARMPTVRVWPFENPAGASLVLAEIWPRLALKGVVKRDAAARRGHVQELGWEIRLRPEHARIASASDHAIDALAAAVRMASGGWPLPRPGALPRASAREGWILGLEPLSPP